MKYSLILPLLVIPLLWGCNSNPAGGTGGVYDTEVRDASYDKTVSPDGNIEAAVLMHSRMGIRIEMNLNKDRLELWISPQAGRETSNRYRNFSCRDDHTGIFDQVTFPELRRKKFIRCDYDPFHSEIYFEGQVMHIATLIDKPVVLVWFDREEVVDFKTDKQDSLLEQSPRFFGVRHPDRGLVLDFYAALGGGPAVFQHQPEVMMHRSIYARAVINKEDFLVIGGELSKENVSDIVAGVASVNLKKLLADSEEKIARAIQPGSLVLNGLPEVQKLYDINQRHMLSVQDASGALHAALRYVYYLIWATDGSVCATSMSQAGNQEFLNLWCNYMLANPTQQSSPPGGRFYGQLVNEKITKREEFGSLCAVWPAFMYWGLTGDNRYVSGDQLDLLKYVVEWVERYCYDPEMKAIGTYYIGGGSEDPFLGSHDYGYDGAVGSFMNRNPRYPRYDRKAILRAYEYGMNLNQYNMYLMLSSVTPEEESRRYIEKAETLARFLKALDSLDSPAWYLLKDAGMVLARRTGRDAGDNKALFAIQDRAAAYYMPDYPKKFMDRVTGYRPYTDSTLQHTYACGVYGVLAGLDNEFMNEEDIMQTILVTLPYHIKPSRFIPMPYSMAEYFGAEEGSFHDIRPQAFSTAPFIAALTNLSIKTLPFGIALRGTKYVKELKDFEYLRGKITVSYSGKGAISGIAMNGKELKYTLQLPDNMVRPGENRINVRMDEKVHGGLSLVYSTVRLKEVSVDKNSVIYQVIGYSQNVLVLKNAAGNIKVLGPDNQEVKTTLTPEGNYTFVEFWGRGEYRVLCEV
jgi:hypothetical protein